jgi:uncharacterized Ntn-hydrolase superfamily protein
MTTMLTGDLETQVPGAGWGPGWTVVRDPKGTTATLPIGTAGHGGAFGTLAWIDFKNGLAYVLMVQRADFSNNAPGNVRDAFLSSVAAGRDVSGTFSIIAVDPDTGVIGAAVASKYPAVGRVVPYVRAGVGAFATQHWHKPPWGEPALDMLASGKTPEDVLATLLKDDKDAGKRQLAILDAKGRGAQRHCDNADPSGIWWGGASGKFYCCQGNTLTGCEVVDAMARAYEQTKGSMADRLVCALLAGDQAGGDHRGRLAAGIKVAKPGVEGLWFELYVDKSDDAVNELVKQYTQLKHGAKGEWDGKVPPRDIQHAK